MEKTVDEDIPEIAGQGHYDLEHGKHDSRMTNMDDSEQYVDSSNRAAHIPGNTVFPAAVAAQSSAPNPSSTATSTKGKQSFASLFKDN